MYFHSSYFNSLSCAFCCDTLIISKAHNAPPPPPRVSLLCCRPCESISPLDDLAFDMYQDPGVAHIIRLLDQRKQDAARQERYELAKALKQAIADLHKVWRAGSSRGFS